MNSKAHPTQHHKRVHKGAHKALPDPLNNAAFSKQIEIKSKRKLQAQHNSALGIWFGLGMMGIIGWSVVVPTLLGIALGYWLDSLYAGSRSWTLLLLVAGLILGCFNAWYWIDKEDQAMSDKQEHKDE